MRFIERLSGRLRPPLILTEAASYAAFLKLACEYGLEIAFAPQL